MPVRLESWAVIDGRGPYDPPEFGVRLLRGIVTGHPRKQDGTIVCTSEIVGAEGDQIRTRSGNLYELGEIDPEYDVKFPNARARLFASLTRQSLTSEMRV